MSVTLFTRTELTVCIATSSRAIALRLVQSAVLAVSAPSVAEPSPPAAACFAFGVERGSSFLLACDGLTVFFTGSLSATSGFGRSEPPDGFGGVVGSADVVGLAVVVGSGDVGGISTVVGSAASWWTPVASL